MASKGNQSIESVNAKLARDQQLQKVRSAARKAQQMKKQVVKVTTQVVAKEKVAMPVWLAVREASARKERAQWNQAKRIEQQKKAMNPLAQALKGLKVEGLAKFEDQQITRELEKLWVK